MPVDRNARSAAEDRLYELCAELDALPADQRPAAIEKAVQQNPTLAESLRAYYRGAGIFAGGLAAARRNVPRIPEADSDEGLAAMSRLLVQLRREGQGAAPLQVGAELGRGGWGRVMEAEDPHLGCRVAVKSLSRNVVHWAGEVPVISEARALARFLEEAQVASQLDHPGVIPIHRLGVDAKGAPYFTMKLVRGITLEQALEVHAGQRTELSHDEPWTLRRVLTTLERVAEALSYAHFKGVVHRDVKPQNILIGHHGETYLLDWGLARVVAEGRPASQGQGGWVTTVPRSVRQSHRESGSSPLVTEEHEVLGTPCYMAPESLGNRADREGAKAYALDVYSLGAIVYRALAGHPPYLEPGAPRTPQAVMGRILTAEPTPIHGLAPHAPPRLMDLCARSMSRDPARRPPSVAQWLHELRAVLAESSSHAATLARAVRTGHSAFRAGEPSADGESRIAWRTETRPPNGQAEDPTEPRKGEPAGSKPADTAPAASGWASWLPWILLTFALGLWAGRFSS